MNKTLYTKPDVLIVDMQVQEILAGTTIQTDDTGKKGDGKITGYGFADEKFSTTSGSWETDDTDYGFSNW